MSFKIGATTKFLVNSLGVDGNYLKNESVLVGALGSQCVTEAKLHTSVAGAGLAGGNGTPLAINTDAVTVEISSDVLRVKDQGIGPNKLKYDIAFYNPGSSTYTISFDSYYGIITKNGSTAYTIADFNGGYGGQIIYITNIGANDITIKNGTNSAGSYPFRISGGDATVSLYSTRVIIHMGTYAIVV
jgi:hypothetical protein